ncbi:DNA segregation ATPase FtsK/SpoIIIE, S-DNA-T family [Sinosporangium album]|uniref:DNA segregation ATPase FtsK/SpoIIIE, S-DNA-T family n=1 Tax=Sinosporangium album TaxID=504805 RepID=A0A1G7W5I3_9ACTN|nr:FtsK/SpoIIIE domain-containing protein [Sinosporangium album]SDG67216.1 DNA segregation ATPase FtsK/SpoIIIE, S-DNA-T family [Sinosporangium album]
MRIMLTVLGEQADREVVVEGDETTTVAHVARSLSNGPTRKPAKHAKVVKLARTRAPYGMDRGADPEPVRLWRDGRELDPAARAQAVLRDGDLVTLDRRLAAATIAEEPAGVVEVRVVGGPAGGAVHRVGLGAHVIGSSPACAIAVPDPLLAAEAVVMRVTPDGVQVKGLRRRRRDEEVPWDDDGRLRRLWDEGLAVYEEKDYSDRPGDRNAEAAPWEEMRGASERLEYADAELAGKRLTRPVHWPQDALLRCGASVFTVRPIEPPDAHLDVRQDGGLAYNRPPRLRETESRRRFEVPAEPKPSEGMRLQLLAAFLPALLGVTMVFILGNWMFLLFALLTPLIFIATWWSDRRHGRKQHRQAMKLYKERMEEFDGSMDRARAADEKARRAAAPDPAEVLLTATGPRRRLWERRVHDADALRLRVGLADLPADVELVPERGASMDMRLPDPPTSRDVPVALAMRRLGVAGVTGPRKVVGGLVRWLVGQAAALHSPRDLAIVVLTAHGDGAARWDFVRWLPHCAPHGAEDCVTLIGGDPETAGRRVAELVALINERLDEDAPKAPGRTAAAWEEFGGSWTGEKRGDGEPAFSSYDQRPYDVLVVVDGAQVLRGLPGMPQVLRQGPRAGVYTLAIDEDQRLLPEECATVAECGRDGMVRLRGGGLDAIGPILVDGVSAAWCDRLARALAPIRDVSRDDEASALPTAARLLDLLELPALTGHAVRKRWRPGTRTTEALIGVGPEGPFTVDLRLDGPHALVAGTTGSGKSELLQTLIASLAAANPPDEMTFVLIDYKGGAAFKECVRLPHTVGMVSDLDGHLTQRALQSLAAEIRRRERLLLASGTKDIDDYLILRDKGVVTEPLPRLVLIIDEFAALVTELPDFVTGLVDIARRGRSLGIHLVLATQRPGGVVTADIQANTSLRIALRVTEPEESADIIDRPDAAHISPSTPGRCYVVVGGGGAATAVQTARVGGRAQAGEETAELRVVDLSWRTLGLPLPAVRDTRETAEVTDLAMLADAVVDAASLAGVARRPSPWLPPLPERVTLAEAEDPAAEGGGEVPPLVFGTTDRPWAQDRKALAVDLVRGGHLLVAGAARTGRSTLLRTIAGSLAARASADDVHLHAIDCGSGALLPLVALPHCGAVVTRDQLERVERLLTRLRDEVGRRQRMLAEAGYASLAELRAAAPPGGERPPWMLLLLDRWEGFVGAFEGYDYGRLIEAFLQLLREGPAVGLRAVVTSDRSGLLGQISTVFDDRLIMKMADSADYGLAGFPMRDLPASMPPGRVLALGEQGLAESQVALLCDDPSGPAQVAALQALAREVAPPRARGPLRVDVLPMHVTAGQAMDLVPDFAAPSPLWALLGVGGDALVPLGVDVLAHGPGAVVAGPSRSGRSSALVTAAHSLLSRGTPVVAVAPRRSPLRDLDGLPGVAAVLSAEGDLRAAVAELRSYVVIVDDAELISPDSPLGMALEEVLRAGRDADHGLLIAGTTGDLTSAYRGFVAEARKSRTGLLLSVQSPADGDLFNVRLARGASGGPPGRGLLVTAGTVTPVQAALP